MTPEPNKLSDETRRKLMKRQGTPTKQKQEDNTQRSADDVKRERKWLETMVDTGCD